jgi:hypothetical protein
LQLFPIINQELTSDASEINRGKMVLAVTPVEAVAVDCSQEPMSVVAELDSVAKRRCIILFTAVSGMALARA